jgi:multiple sugar transport system substrate-binding protein
MSISGLGLTGTGTQQERIAARTLALFLFRRDAYINWLHMAPGGMLPVIEGTLADDAFMRDRLGLFQAFGWGVTRRFGRALRIPATFSVTGKGDAAYAVPFAGRLYADGTVGRMVARVLSGEMDPQGAAARAQAEALLLMAQPPGQR